MIRKKKPEESRERLASRRTDQHVLKSAAGLRNASRSTETTRKDKKSSGFATSGNGSDGKNLDSSQDKLFSIEREHKKDEELEVERVSDYDSDEEKFRGKSNTIGNIPIVWYDDLPHIGYDVQGNRILRPLKSDELDQLLSKLDENESGRSIYDPIEGKKVDLTDEEIQIIQRIQQAYYPDSNFDAYPEYVDYYTKDKELMPISNAPQPKRRFLPSKWEAKKIIKLVRAIRRGHLKFVEAPKKPRWYTMWDVSTEQEVNQKDSRISAPRMKLPDHTESYNPPEEYLPTPEEIKKWEQMDPEDRPMNFIPQKYSNLRKVPGYKNYVQERFERCLDLYLCPRVKKLKMNIDPESLLPKLPKPKDLQPFPTFEAIVYRGHTDKVRSLSIDPTGQWFVSGSDDKTLRLWELSTGRCLRHWSFKEKIRCVSWNPSTSINLFAAVLDTTLMLIDPMLGPEELRNATDAALLASKKRSEDVTGDVLISWQFPKDRDNKEKGIRVVLQHQLSICHFAWHRKGDYFTTIGSEGGTNSVLIHLLSRAQSQSPFLKLKNVVQRACFHPTKPFFFVATQRHIRVYNLAKHELSKRLQPGVQQISSLDIHPQGDSLIVGSYDQRVCWFDMDLSSRPYKTLRYHKAGVRQVTFHRSYPLFASCADDGLVHIFHGMVYNDMMQNPLIVPVRILRGHGIRDHLGVLDCEFHPHQPWILTCGADNTIRLYS